MPDELYSLQYETRDSADTLLPKPAANIATPKKLISTGPVNYSSTKKLHTQGKELARGS